MSQKSQSQSKQQQQNLSLKRVPGNPILIQKALEKQPKRLSIDVNGYYKILGFKPHESPSQDEIREAFRTKVKLVHPDGASPDINEFLKLKQAYSVLSNPMTRKFYDLLTIDEVFIDETMKPLIQTEKTELKKITVSCPTPQNFVYYLEEGVEKPDNDLVNEWANLFIDVGWELGFSKGKEVRLGFSSTEPKVVQRPWGAILMVSGAPDKNQAIWLAITAEILSKSKMLATDMLE